jgi:hypothetical protein
MHELQKLDLEFGVEECKWVRLSIMFSFYIYDNTNVIGYYEYLCYNGQGHCD